jgi:hypothetical protein
LSFLFPWAFALFRQGREPTGFIIKRCIADSHLLSGMLFENYRKIKTRILKNIVAARIIKESFYQYCGIFIIFLSFKT